MPRTDFDDEPDDEGPGEHDAHLLDDEDAYGGGDESDTVACPSCGRYILAEADRCHRCGATFNREAWLVQRSKKQVVWLVAVILVLIAMLWFLWG